MKRLCSIYPPQSSGIRSGSEGGGRWEASNGEKYHMDHLEQGPFHWSFVLAVVSSLKSFTFRAGRKENSSEWTPQGASWVKSLYPPSPLQKYFFFPLETSLSHGSGLHNREYFPKYVFRTFCKIASSWFFDRC